AVSLGSAGGRGGCAKRGFSRICAIFARNWAMMSPVGCGGSTSAVAGSAAAGTGAGTFTDTGSGARILCGSGGGGRKPSLRLKSTLWAPHGQHRDDAGGAGEDELMVRAVPHRGERRTDRDVLFRSVGKNEPYVSVPRRDGDEAVPPDRRRQAIARQAKRRRAAHGSRHAAFARKNGSTIV